MTFELTENADGDVELIHDSSGDSLILNSLSTDDTATKTIGAGETLYAGDHDGGDADTRLDNAISAASSGSTIVLEQASYSDDRTISSSFVFIGRGQNLPGNGNGINGGKWTVNSRCVFIEIAVLGSIGSELDLSAARCRVIGGHHSTNGTITVNADTCILTALHDAGVTFASGTSGGVIDSSANTTVTDNGTNTVGDVA